MRITFCIQARQRALQAFLTLIIVLGLTTAASAQTYLVDVSNVGGAVAIEQAEPGYPGGLVPLGQDG